MKRTDFEYMPSEPVNPRDFVLGLIAVLLIVTAFYFASSTVRGIRSDTLTDEEPVPVRQSTAPGAYSNN